MRYYMKPFLLALFLSTAVYSQATDTFSKPFVEAAKIATPSVVSIKVKGKPKSNPLSDNTFGDDFFRQFFGTPKQKNSNETPQALGQASGFVVSPDGYILTNSHVIRDADSITVIFNDEKEYDGKVIGHDPNTDLAVVKIDAKDLPFLKLGDSEEVEVGEWVLAVGNPLGLQASVTAGIVSAKGRNNLDLLNIEDFIQTDAAINMGNSGGPLVDLNGNVIGINTAIVSNAGGYMGIGFSIPSNIAQHIMDQLISSGEVTRGFLGVNLQRVDSNLAESFGLKKAEGALVVDVTPNSPAEKAGLKQGDVILKLNNTTVQNRTAFRNQISLTKPGTKVTLEFSRSGQTQTASVVLAAFPTTESPIADNKLGLEFEALTPEIAKNLGLINEQGVVISKVTQGSVAAWAGIKKGALIVAVNHKKVTSVAEVKDAIEKTEKSKPILLLIKEGDMTRFVSLKF